jgi:hypothetical protein
LEPGALPPGDDHRHGQILEARLLARELGATGDHALQPDRAERSQHGRDVAVRQRAADLQRLVGRADGGASLQQDAQALDDVHRRFGEIGEGALLDFAVLPPALAQQDGGG